MTFQVVYLLEGRQWSSLSRDLERDGKTPRRVREMRKEWLQWDFKIEGCLEHPGGSVS